ncbi:GspE/PulE family protein [Falsiroseomonas sp. CW058]|uniref:GspE/PulE family protein n=1 Tax=Falsiroseomonas sp. CW058 TaxID=3388664 RepID=UPI003D31C27A
MTAEGAGARLAGHLAEHRLLPPAALARAQDAARATGATLHEALLALGLLSEEALAEAASRALGLRLLGRADLPADPILPDRLPPRFLRRARAWPAGLTADGALLLAVADPLDPFAVQAVALATGLVVAPAVAPPSAIAAVQAALAEQEEQPAAAVTAAPAEDDATRLRDLASEAPVVRHVNALILAAVEAGASDIHLEPGAGVLRTRLRVDGVLREAGDVPGALRDGVVSRLKIMARLDVAERRLPQDGRLRIAVRGRDIDLRISVVPALDGEAVVLRILDRASVTLDLAALGYDPAERAAFAALLSRTSRMVLVTGPTGSGKTTTLYAALATLDARRQKICTIEDPVEYRLEGVTQVQVQPGRGLDFPAALRAMLRHDPDVMLVGEIRDPATAEVATQAALTGHLVLATLHTNDAPSAVTRLLDLGVPDYLIASVLEGVVAQRLARRLCTACREPFALPAALPGLAAGTRLHRPRGCAACGGTGWRGRRALVQVMPMSAALRDCVLRRADANAIAAQAAADGMPTLVEAGLRLARAGETSVEEVLRVAGGT